jgi:hypothetical protein
MNHFGSFRNEPFIGNDDRGTPARKTFSPREGTAAEIPADDEGKLA